MPKLLFLRSVMAWRVRLRDPSSRNRAASMFAGRFQPMLGYSLFEVELGQLGRYIHGIQFKSVQRASIA